MLAGMASSPIRRVTFRNAALRFPPRCVDCGGAPDGRGVLTARQPPVTLRLPAPFCKACPRARLRRRILWYLGTLGLMALGLLVIGVIQDGGYVSKQSPLLPILTVLVIAFALFWYFREAAVFHAWYSRIWIARFDDDTVTLASRDEALLHAIEEGGGVVKGAKG